MVPSHAGLRIGFRGGSSEASDGGAALTLGATRGSGPARVIGTGLSHVAFLIASGLRSAYPAGVVGTKPMPVRRINPVPAPAGACAIDSDGDCCGCAGRSSAFAGDAAGADDAAGDATGGLPGC